jgi:2,3-bisphosphoglycerate-independent phosphoglycerate mutase
MRILLVVLDGVGDRPCKELNGRTPLEAANKPVMNSLAEKGMLGLVQLVREGFATETDSGVLSILGYDVMKYYTGRGPLEAYGAGLRVSEGNIAFRVNFATGGDGRIIDRRVCRDLSDGEADILVRDVNAKVKLTGVPAAFELKSIGGYRCSLVIRKSGGMLSGNITNTDPAYRKVGHFSIPEKTFKMAVQECNAMDSSKEAAESARLANEFHLRTSEFLGSHWINMRRVKEGKPPANLMLMRDCGDHLPLLPPLERKFKARFGFAAEVFVERGIALLTESKLVDMGKHNEDCSANYSRYAKAVLKAMDEFDVTYVHIKGPDEPGHDGEPVKKKRSIEAIDKYFFGNLLPHIDLKYTIITITSDHSTPCELKTHSSDPVPLLMAGGNNKPGRAKAFDEVSCAQGDLKTIHGMELMPLLIKLAGGHEIPETYLK